jgi:hypothetical protein
MTTQTILTGVMLVEENPSVLWGHWQTWLLLGAVWVALGLLSALALGVIARVGHGRRKRL